MNQYFLPKTGWEFFDVSRAYGLGILVDVLSGDVEINDMGGYYLIKTSSEPVFHRIDDIFAYFGSDDDWKMTLITIQRSTKADLKRGVIKIRNQVTKLFKDLDKIEEILKKFKKTEIKPPPVIGRGSQTLYQTLDLAATKGIRDEILLKKRYSEGSNINVSIEDFSLSIIGHINYTIRRFSDVGMIVVTPTPQATKVEDSMEMFTNLKNAIKGVHRAGWFPSLAQIATNLVLEELRVEEGGKFAPKFGSLIYGVMMKTGNQWKPLTGGIFPLDFLHQIAKSSKAKDVLHKWKYIFERTAPQHMKGYEDLPVTLAEFIANPSLSNYERYIKLHLRNELDKDRVKFGGYEKKVLEEVIKNVGI